MSLQIMLAAVSIKAGYPFGELMDWHSGVSMGGVSTSTIWNYAQMQKTYSEKYYVCCDLGMQLSYLLRLKTTGKQKRGITKSNHRELLCDLSGFTRRRRSAALMR